MPFTLEPSPKELKPKVLDWSDAPLARYYDGFYIKVIDDLFTPAECAALIALAESDQKWEQAAVHFGLGPDQNVVDTSYRNSERILRFDADAAQQLLNRLLPYISELVEIKPGGEWETIVAKKGNMKTVWKLVGVNERLSFLRYGPGHFFKGHPDGQLELPDGRKSRVTVQIYLNDEGVKGGETRMFAPGSNYKRHLDVKPKTGRVLIFQQRGMYHTGEEVTKGLKYAVRSDFLFVENPVDA